MLESVTWSMKNFSCFYILTTLPIFPLFTLFQTFQRFLRSGDVVILHPQLKMLYFFSLESFPVNGVKSLVPFFLIAAFLQTLCRSKPFPSHTVPEIPKSRRHWCFSPIRESNARSFLSKWGKNCRPYFLLDVSNFNS